MKPIILAFLFLIPALTIYSCKNSITAPAPPLPGRRDYTWTVDTLDSPMNYLQTIWGASPNDVWAGGSGGEMEKRLFHYDGTKWSPYKVPPGCFPNVIFGFDSNDVWIGGEGGYVWHYDGDGWKISYQYRPKQWKVADVQDIWGAGPNDVYAVGVIVPGSDLSQKGFILHYNGIRWDSVYEAKFYSQFLVVRGEGNNLYVENYQTSYGKNGAADTIQFYQYNGGSLHKIFSNTLDNIHYAVLNNIEGKAYFVISNNIYRYTNGTLTKQFSIDESDFGYQIYGRTPADIFLRMKGSLAHYNGTDVKYLYRFSNSYTGVMNVPAIFDKEVFFAVWDPLNGTNMVLHGKLK